MASQKLKVAIAGLGRMGARHAHHFYALTPRAQVTAVSSPDQEELNWAKKELDGAQTYLSFDEMLEKEKDLEAVVIASATSVHAEQAIKAIKRRLHVLCEKPLSINVEEVIPSFPSVYETSVGNYAHVMPSQSQAVVNAYRQSQKDHPSQKVMCGFSRRFDASYRDAFQKVQDGSIGRPSVFRSQTCDKLDPTGFFIEYAQYSGGIFVDCSIHDIDLALWFFGEESVVKSVSAVGITAVSPELRKYDDRDNALGILEFHDGKIAQLFCSRMMAAGQEDSEFSLFRDYRRKTY